VAQINKAMGQVDELTQRNASASEELSSTAEELSAQAESLQELIAFFQLPGAVQQAVRRGHRTELAVSDVPAKTAAAATMHPTFPRLAAAKAAAGVAGAGRDSGFQRF
jgi:methyl-accepting chemotaxis protein